MANYRAHLALVRSRSPSPQLDFPDICLGDSVEKLSALGLVNLTEKSMRLAFNDEEKLKNFGKTKGLHSTIDKVVRYEFDLVVTKINLEVETLSDWTTGVSKRVDLSDIGPAKGSFTWKTISNLAQLHLGYYLPINRMQNLINLSIFSDVNIYRQFESLSMMFLPIYIELGAELSDSSYFQFDDTKPNVIEMKKMANGNFEMRKTDEEKQKDSEDNKRKNEVMDLLEEEFGRFSERADGKGLQKKISMSCVVGSTDDNDPKSGICFYRTHYGHAGNLLEKLLEQRSPLKKDIILQGDLASWNKAPEKYYALFNITFAGCSSHARRPFKLHSEDDNALCDQMLFYFLLLAKMETRIDERGRTVKRVLFYRKHYGQKVWDKILELSESVLSAKKLSECSGHYVWPPSSKFGLACKYIKKHIKELTAYLKIARVSPDNNKVERLLRPEKLYLNNSKRKETEWAKTCSDILRTILMTCQFAEVSFEEYLKFVYKNKDKLQENPSLFTPYAFSKLRAEDKLKTEKTAA